VDTSFVMGEPMLGVSSAAGGTPSRAAYASLAVARSGTGCGMVLIPGVEEPVTSLLKSWL